MKTDNKNCETIVAFEKNNYFYGKLLTVDDFQTEQKYFHQKSILSNRELEGIGILSGLDVTNLDMNTGDEKFTMDITAGYALDSCGNLIVMEYSRAYSISYKSVDSNAVYLYIEYKDCNKDRVESITKSESCETNCCYNRTLESFELKLYKDNLNHQGVLLSIFEKEGNAYIPSNRECRFLLSNQELEAQILSHQNDTDNPHKVSAEQVGAIKSINHLQNDGKNINLVSENDSIDITENSENHSINLELSETALAKIDLKIQTAVKDVKSNLNLVLQFLMHKTLKYKLHAFSIVFEHFESKIATEIVKEVKEAIDVRIYLRQEKFLTLMKYLYKLEKNLEAEVKEHASEKEFKAYELAIVELNEAMATGDLFSIAVAQDEICEKAEKLVSLNKIKVPELISLDINDSRKMLAKVGLLLGNLTYTVSTKPLNSVLTQTPTTGTEVEKGSLVNVSIAIQATTTKVPNVIELDLYTATNTIINSQLHIGSINEEISSDFESGTVLKQEPTENTDVALNSPVNLTVAKEQKITTVPNLFSHKEEEAEEILSKSQLQLGEVKTKTSTSPAGTVISQIPRVGSKVAINSEVSIVIATAAEMTIVPNFTGKNIQKDEKTIQLLLEKSKLQQGGIRYEFSNRSAGTILNQNPRENSRVPIKTAIDFAIARNLSFEPRPLPPFEPRPIPPFDVIRDPVVVTPRPIPKPTPIRTIDGIGAVYERRLDSIGIKTTEDLVNADAKLVAETLKTNDVSVRRMMTDALRIRNK